MKVAFAAAVVAMAGYGVYTNQKTEPMSDVMRANVEALAGGEGIIEIEYCCAGSGYCSIDGEAFDGTKYEF